MNLPRIVPTAEWQVARDDLLVKEKAATRVLDALAAERRRLPMVRIADDYVFQGPEGTASLLEPAVSALTADVRRYFEGPNIAHIATVLPDGAPHTVPVWVDMQGEQIAFLTSPDSRKARNLEGDSRLAISVTERDQLTAMALVRGRVVERMEGDPAWAIIDRISHKYIGQPYPLRTDRVVFLVEVDHAWAQAY